ncbi:MAG: hypothetical protein ACREFY_04380 [Acetobacteraceae bacterium]
MFAAFSAGAAPGAGAIDRASAAQTPKFVPRTGVAPTAMAATKVAIADPARTIGPLTHIRGSTVCDTLNGVGSI